MNVKVSNVELDRHNIDDIISRSEDFLSSGSSFLSDHGMKKKTLQKNLKISSKNDFPKDFEKSNTKIKEIQRGASPKPKLSIKVQNPVRFKLEPD